MNYSVHVLTPLQNISKPLPSPSFLLFLQSSVQRTEMLSEHPAHHNRTPRACDAYPIRVPVRRSPAQRPDISVMNVLSVYPTAQLRTHDPATFPNCENPLISDRHTARFDGGRGNELLIHAYITANPAYDCAMRKLTQYIFSQIFPDMNRWPSQRHVARCCIHGTDRDDEANDARDIRASHVIKPLLLPVRTSNLIFRRLRPSKPTNLPG